MSEKGVYWVAEEVEPIAQSLIYNHHRHLYEHEATLVYLFTTKKRQKQGKVILGTAQKTNDLLAYLTGEFGVSGVGADFILIFDHTWWQHLKPQQRRALVDHELCHCGWDEGPVMLPHDLEEFTAIVERYGYWRSDVVAMGKAMQHHQMPLEFDDSVMTLTSNGHSVTVKGKDADTEEEEPLDEDLVRRALNIVEVQPLVSVTVLHRALGCKWKTAGRLIERFREDGTIGKIVNRV